MEDAPVVTVLKWNLSLFQQSHSVQLQVRDYEYYEFVGRQKVTIQLVFCIHFKEDYKSLMVFNENFAGD